MLKANNQIIAIANKISSKGIKNFDSLHIACALYSKTDCFLTTDDGILNKASLIEEINIIDPIGFIQELSL